MVAPSRRDVSDKSRRSPTDPFGTKIPVTYLHFRPHIACRARGRLRSGRRPPQFRSFAIYLNDNRLALVVLHWKCTLFGNITTYRRSFFLPLISLPI
jgi:hypothetical protein